jgi:hypothetical protein
MSNDPTYDAALTPAEILAITQTINAMPGINHRIIGVVVRDKQTVIVRTGTMRGPRFGSGDLITLKFVDNDWKAVETSGWIS